MKVTVKGYSTGFLEAVSYFGPASVVFYTQGGGSPASAENLLAITTSGVVISMPDGVIPNESTVLTDFPDAIPLSGGGSIDIDP